MQNEGNRIGRPLCTILFCAFASLLTSCVASEDSPSSPDTSTSSPAIRVDLNVYTPGFVPMGIGEPNNVSKDLADEWMARHSGKRIEYQQLITTGGSEGEWLKTQLLAGIAPEILSMNAEVAWLDTDKGWYVPLDEFMERPNPYIPGNEHWIDSFLNQPLVQAKRAPDGKLYCVSLDIVETGVFYNKDLLERLGMTEFPRTWQGMVELLDKVSSTRAIPMISDVNMSSDWGQDIIFEMLYHDIIPLMDLVPSRPDAVDYMGHYLDPPEAGFLFTKGFFTHRDPRWREMNRLLREWRNYWPKELKNSDAVRLFLTGRAATFWSGSWLIRRMAEDPYIDFDWGVAYIPAITKETSRFASGSSATVIGGSAIQLHVTNSAIRKGTLEDCIDFLMFLCAPENIERLTSEALLFIPNVKGARMDERLQPFSEIFQRRYCAIKWLELLDGEYKKYWRRMLDYYLNDGVNLDQFIEMLEENFGAWVKDHEGEVGWDFNDFESRWKDREAALAHELDPSH